MRLADASAVSFVAPMLVTLGAVHLFRQRAPAGTWLALAASFAGVLLVIQPGSATFTWAALLPLGTAVFAAIYQLLTSRVAGVDDPTATLFIGALICAIASLSRSRSTGPGRARSPTACCSPGSAPWGAFSHYLIIRAFGYAPAVVLAPFAYLQIVAALLLGWLVFGNYPGPMSLFGMALIVVTGVTMGMRQRGPPTRPAAADLKGPADLPGFGACRLPGGVGTRAGKAVGPNRSPPVYRGTAASGRADACC
jgi:drug/metabolite transporter (DMT)-like permease